MTPSPTPDPSGDRQPPIPPHVTATAELPPEDEAPEPALDDHPSLIVYPLGIALWAFGASLILGAVPPSARTQALGIVLFLLPLAMAVLSAFVHVFTRAGFPLALRVAARTLVFACLWPFVAWGQWDAKRRNP